jgi:hypothetical protein
MNKGTAYLRRDSQTSSLYPPPNRLFPSRGGRNLKKINTGYIACCYTIGETTLQRQLAEPFFSRRHIWAWLRIVEKAFGPKSVRNCGPKD